VATDADVLNRLVALKGRRHHPIPDQRIARARGRKATRMQLGQGEPHERRKQAPTFAHVAARRGRALEQLPGGPRRREDLDLAKSTPEVQDDCSDVREGEPMSGGVTCVGPV